MTQQIPTGYHTVTPMVTFKDCNKAIEFYKKAFNAELVDKFTTMDGKKIMHATVKIGDSIIMMADEMQMGDKSTKSAETLHTSPVGFYVYVKDVDSTFNQAVAAGGQVMMPVADMFWGDRSGSLMDMFGYSWMIATQTKTLSKDQILENAKEFFNQ